MEKLHGLTEEEWHSEGAVQGSSPGSSSSDNLDRQQ